MTTIKAKRAHAPDYSEAELFFLSFSNVNAECLTQVHSRLSYVWSSLSPPAVLDSFQKEFPSTVHVSHKKMSRKRNLEHGKMIKLLDLYKENNTLLNSKFKSTVTAKKKKDKWAEICNAINAIGQQQRTVDEIKHCRSSNLRSF